MNLFSSRRLPIGNTLIAALVLAALIPALLAAWLLSTNSSQSINTLAENAMSQAAHRVDVGALAHLGEAHTVVNALVPPFSGTDAEAARTRNWLVDTAAFETMAYALTQQSPNVPYLYMGTANGSFFGVEREDQGFVAREIRPGDPGRKHFLIGHPGDRSQLLREETQVYDPRKRPWYQLALSTGQRSFTDVYRSAVKSQFDLTLAHPIFDTDNRTVLGVVAVDMSLARLTDLIRSSRISENAVTYLVDSQGLLVASSVEEELSLLVNNKFQRLSPLQSQDPLVRESFTQLSAQYRDTLRRDPGLLRLDTASGWRQWLGMGSSRLIALQRPFGQKYQLNWQLIVVAPESDFTKQVIQARKVALLALAGLISLGGVLAFLVARGLSGQFQLLNASATAVGAGQVPGVQQKTGFREVHHLSKVLHDSARSLHASTREIHEKNEQLREAALMLEERVRQRTAELAASREEALAAVKAKAGFLAVMSHEIRTPLNGVVGMSHLLRETPLTSGQQEMLGVLEVSSEQLLSVVDDILDFSRIESGKLALENNAFDLRAAIRQAHDILMLRAQEKGLHLSLHIAADVPKVVMGDITRLRQVLINLLSNAIKFTHQGEVTLRVWQEPSAEGTMLSFSVSDTGVGIRQERIGELFQPFAQGDTSITRVYGGTGLGLMICKHLVEMMGGHITVNSQPGAGSTFRFTIRSAAADPALLPVAQASELPRASHQQRVLVVDDNLINLKVASAMLQRLGYEHQAVTSGRQALDATKLAMREGRPYALVLLDSHMPDLDGIATARSLQAQWGPQTPVMIGVSASSLGEDRQRCLEAGMADYLPKPLDLEQLAHTLRRLAPQPATVASDRTSAEDLAASANAGDSDRLIDPQRWEAFAEFDDDSGNLRREIVGDFLHSLPERVSEIGRAAVAGDTAALRHASHVLKGAAGNVGAEGLVRCCEDIERQAHKAPQIGWLIREIESVSQATANALKEM
jgi:signal transduction histidine kinase/CheY-like chemotaxis protein/HPt (histidine-containing phosphotransfer) domain-containing protein